MSHSPTSTKWRWRHPQPPFGISWPLKGEARQYFVTRNGLLADGIPIFAPIEFPSAQYLASLPQSLAPDDRPVTKDQLDTIIAEARAEWVAAGYGEAGPPAPRGLQARQLQFVMNICKGMPVLDAYERAGYRRKFSNAQRLLHQENVVEAIFRNLGSVG